MNKFLTNFNFICFLKNIFYSKTKYEKTIFISFSFFLSFFNAFHSIRG